MPKIISNRPWILVIGFFLTFVAVWVAFICFAVKHQPVQVPIVSTQAAESHAAD